MKLVKDINFLPDYVISKHVKMKKQLNFIFMGLLLVLGISSLVLIPKGIYYYYQNQEQNMNQQINELSNIQFKLEKLTAIEKSKKDKELILNNINKKQFINGKVVTITQLVNQINNALPRGKKLNYYTISSKRMTTSVQVNSPLETIGVIKSLEDMGIFDKIIINSFPIVDKTENININLEFK